VGAAANGHLTQWNSRLIVIGINGLDAILFHDGGTFFCAVADLLGVLEDEVNGVVAAPLVHLHGKGRQRRTVSVMAALVRNAWDGGAIGQIDGLVDGKGVKIGAEAQLFPAGRTPMDGIEPGAPVYNLQFGVLTQKIHQVGLGPELLIGQFRMHMQLMAQLDGQTMIVFVHINPSRFRLIWYHHSMSQDKTQESGKSIVLCRRFWYTEHNGYFTEFQEGWIMKKKVLGRTGLQVSVAGFGVLPMGPSQLALPVEEGAAVIRYALERGINFIDTAQYYRTYPYIRKALEGGGFEQVVLCSKSLCADYEGMMDAISEAQEALDRQVIDIFLMHEVRSGQLAERAGAWQALIDAKTRGLVRAIGLSTHHVDIAAAAADIPELDVIFPLINYAGLGIRKGDAFATREEMLEAISACHQAGKGVFSMKAFGGGSLTAHYQQALDFVFAQPDIDSVMIGFGKTAEVDDLMNYLSGAMPTGYNPDISKKKVHINHEDCEGCGSCKAACPAGAIYWGENGLAEVDHQKCLTCGYCSPVCPVRAVIMY